MTKTIFTVTAALVAATATGAVAQTSISDFRGPVIADRPSDLSAPHLEADFGNFSDADRFNRFQGPVLRY